MDTARSIRSYPKIRLYKFEEFNVQILEHNNPLVRFRRGRVVADLGHVYEVQVDNKTYFVLKENVREYK